MKNQIWDDFDDFVSKKIKLLCFLFNVFQLRIIGAELFDFGVGLVGALLVDFDLLLQDVLSFLVVVNLLLRLLILRVELRDPKPCAKRVTKIGT